MSTPQPAIGVTLGPEWRPEDPPDIAVEVERLGFGELWLVEDCLHAGRLTVALGHGVEGWMAQIGARLANRLALLAETECAISVERFAQAGAGTVVLRSPSDGGIEQIRRFAHDVLPRLAA